MRNFIILIFLFIICGCNKFSNSDHFAPIKNHPKDIFIKTLELEELELESIESSYVGKLFIKDDFIGFIDRKFTWVFLFDKDGRMITRHLGHGGGPNEIPSRIDGYTVLDDSSNFFVGPVNDCYIFDVQFQNKKSFVINKTNYNNEAKDFEKPWIYTLCYDNLVLKNFSEYLYYNVVLEHPRYNFFISHISFFRNAHIISKLNLVSGEVEKVLGNYPDIYAKDKSLRQISLINFDIDSKGVFYVSYEADSLIYTFDKNFSPIMSFGYKGREMINKNDVLSIMSFRKNYRRSRSERGYYNGIDYIEETDILFRTYQKGSDTGSGLQIYKQSILIGDVDVPNGFKILGYIYPYYYASCGIDEDNEKILLYKFKSF